MKAKEAVLLLLPPLLQVDRLAIEEEEEVEEERGERGMREDGVLSRRSAVDWVSSGGWAAVWA